MIIIRAFIGIDFNDDMKKFIKETQQRLRKYAIKGRWKHSDNFHLTLKFLDEISLKQQESIDRAMKEIAISNRSFNLGIKELSAFEGRDGSIRVAWLGLSGDISDLTSLQNDTENALSPIGFPTERRSYTPHITIGQDIVFDCRFDEIRNSIGEVRFNPVRIDSIYLFKSEQVQNKRVYTKVANYELGS